MKTKFYFLFFLTFTSANAKGKGDKSLVSDKEYTSFKIHLEWKVSPGSNSGFFWGVKEDMKYGMSTSLGFGGHNACIIMKKFEE